MGGKARLRKWLLNYFPKTGNTYIEPFAGLGNVFFQARKELRFDRWHLSDINVDFFTALLEADLDNLPDKVEKKDFIYWKNANNHISKLIESRITFAGKGYIAGFSGGHPSHSPYNGKLYREVCKEAKLLLSGVQVVQCKWNDLDYSILTKDDFVYFDPPYFKTQASYPNINHEELIDLLNNATFRWAISGYESDLYKSSLRFARRYTKLRNSEIKGSNSRKKEPVCEVLWLGGEY